jgi:hypothetical protein
MMNTTTLNNILNSLLLLELKEDLLIDVIKGWYDSLLGNILFRTRTEPK